MHAGGRPEIALLRLVLRLDHAEAGQLSAVARQLLETLVLDLYVGVVRVGRAFRLEVPPQAARVVALLEPREMCRASPDLT